MPESCNPVKNRKPLNYEIRERRERGRLKPAAHPEGSPYLGGEILVFGVRRTLRVSRKGYRAEELQPDPSIHLTQKAQGAQKERKRRLEQPCYRAEAQRRGGAWAILWGGSICVHLRYLRLKIRNFHGMENILRETIRMRFNA
jgi:hypothetical protein